MHATWRGGLQARILILQFDSNTSIIVVYSRLFANDMDKVLWKIWYIILKCAYDVKFFFLQSQANKNIYCNRNLCRLLRLIYAIKLYIV